MRSLLSKTKHFIKNNKWWSALIAIIILFVIYFGFIKKPAENIVDLVKVERRTIVEEVSTTGKVKALSDISLAFERAGKVSKISVSIGSKVSQNQFLASISNADLSAILDEANANLKAAEAKLEQVKKGSTPEEIAVSQSQVEKAKSDLNEAKTSLINSVRDAYTKSDDAIRNKTDDMFENPRTTNPKLKFQTNNFQLATDINSGRANLESTLATWSYSSASLTVDSDLNMASDNANQNLNTVKNFLEQINLALNSAVTDSTITQATIDGWKTSVATARTNIALGISNLSSFLTGYKSAESLLKVAEEQLALTKASATTEEIKTQEAIVEQVEASVENAKANLEKSIIRSPITGTVSRVDMKVGETIQSGINVITVISFGEYEIEALIPEADIAKVKIGDIATTTLDAYGPDIIFRTTVIKIDPAETLIENVPTYKTTFKFAGKDDRVKSGMTANLDIGTDKRENALSIPSRSVFSRDNKRFVKIISEDGAISNKEVKTGIRGIDGYMEIVSGLTESESVLASPNL